MTYERGDTVTVSDIQRARAFSERGKISVKDLAAEFKVIRIETLEACATAFRQQAELAETETIYLIYSSMFDAFRSSINTLKALE